jgi:hypothetical protein
VELIDQPNDSNQDETSESSQQLDSDTAYVTIPARQLGSQWKPGQSGNPAGRPPKNKSFVGIIRNLPDRDKESVIKAQLDKAIKSGSTQAAEFLVSYAEGKPRQTVDVHDAGDAWRLELLDRLAMLDGTMIDGESRLLDT